MADNVLNLLNFYAIYNYVIKVMHFYNKKKSYGVYSVKKDSNEFLEKDLLRKTFTFIEALG